MQQVTQQTRSRKWGLIVRSLLYIFVMLTFLAIGWFVIPTSVQYHLTERYAFTSLQQDATIYLAVIVPKTGPYQTVENIHIIWNGTQEQISYPSVDVLKFRGAIRAGETQIATIAYDVILRQGPARWAAPVTDFQLKPQTDIESDQAVLVHQASQIASGQTRKDVYSIYTFTSNYLSWPQGTRIGGNESALTAYITRVGGCGEFANLAVALYRADQIPAQAITGLALPSYPPFWSVTKTWNHPGGAHAWVEVNTDAGWELTDPSWGSYWPGPLKRIWFGRNDGSHLSYGESGQYTELYDELTSWGEKYGTLIGGMSNPLHFVSTASSAEVSITPSVTLRKGWDGRWIVTVSLYLLLIVLIRVLENYFKRRPQKGSQ
jgi:hypothetical protein